MAAARDKHSAPGPWRDAVAYGRRLVVETYGIIGPDAKNPAMRYAGNNLSCQSCHLNGGTQRYGLPLIGVYGVFPTYIARENEVRTLEERINGCFERSMNGRALPPGGKEMKALVSYMQFLSTGVACRRCVRRMRHAAAETFGARRRSGEGCRCLQARIVPSVIRPTARASAMASKGDTKGYLYPPLWGPDKFQ